MTRDRRRHSRPVKFDVHRNLPPTSTKPVVAADQPLPSPKKWTWRRNLFWFLTLFFSLSVLLLSWDAISLSRASRQLFGSGNILTLLSTQQPRGAADGRVNILLVGYSADDPGHPGAKLTDSLIVLSLSTQSKRSYMLSVPRDLFVNIPGFGAAKINEAYQDGGIKLLEQVISQDFAINLNYYMLIDYAAVRNLVNALGGISVNIQSPDPRGLYDPNINKHDGGPLKLSNGWQKLNGQTALNLTRARGDSPLAYGFPQADFDRTQHQRQVLAAIKSRLGWWLVLNPLENGKLAQALAKHIKTDIPANQARSVFGLYNSLQDKQLQSVGLRDVNGQNLLASYNAGGLSALIPAAGYGDYSQLQSAIDKLDSSAALK